MTKFDNSLESLKLANMKLMLTADASFEEKHPRDGGKFTSKGGGDSGNDADDPENYDEEYEDAASINLDKVFTDYAPNLAITKSGEDPLAINTMKFNPDWGDPELQKYEKDYDEEVKKFPKQNEEYQKRKSIARTYNDYMKNRLKKSKYVSRFVGVDELRSIVKNNKMSFVKNPSHPNNNQSYTLNPDSLLESGAMASSLVEIQIPLNGIRDNFKVLKANPSRSWLGKTIGGGQEIDKQFLKQMEVQSVKNSFELPKGVRFIQRGEIPADLSEELSKKYDDSSLMQGKLQTGSLQDRYTDQNGYHFASYFLINDTENMKGWGVTTESIPRHIGSFKGMPFVVTAKRFFEKSPYGEMTDHPSTDHFESLGIRIGKVFGPMWRVKEYNDLMQQAKFQEEFRVGNIDEVFRKDNGDWHALVRIKPEFSDMQLPTQVSPALFQLNPAEPQNKITTWVGMHLAGLDESPAYGNVAVFKGTCFGTSGECMRKLSAGMNEPFMPCFKTKLTRFNLKVAQIRLDIIRKEAAQMSGDHSNIQHQNILSEDDTPDYSSKDIVHEI